MTSDQSAPRSDSSAPAVVSSYTENPWPGLASYTEEQRDMFFGRTSEIDQLFRRVKRSVLTVLFGQSGLGKSSLLSAGLFPRLRGAGYLPVPVRLDFGDSKPLAWQVHAALKAALNAAGSRQPLPSLTAERTLWELFHRTDVTFVDAQGQPLSPVLVFDQFEELFTLGLARPERRPACQTFIIELAHLVENRMPISLERQIASQRDLLREFNFEQNEYRVLLSLREDFLPHLDELRDWMPALMDNRMRLARMNGQQALEAVLGPGGDLVTYDVAVEIVKFVAGEATDQAAPNDDLDSIDVEPSLLSLVCSELNLRRVSQGLPQITAKLLAGNRDSILHDFYERCLADQPPSVRTMIEDELLTESGMRENLSLERARRLLVQRGAPPDALDRLVRRRLLHVEERLGVQRIELTHDVLTDVVRRSREERHKQEALERGNQSAKEAATALWRKRRRAAALVTSLLVGLLSIVAIAGWIRAGSAVGELDELNDELSHANEKLTLQVAETDRQRALAEAARDTARTELQAELEAKEKLQQELATALASPRTAVNAFGLEEFASGFEGQNIDGDLIRDLDFAFELRRPSSDWEILDYRRVTENFPDACLGLTNPRSRGQFFVIVDPLGVGTLDDFADRLALTPGNTETSRESIELAGGTALKVESTLLTEGIELRSVRYLIKVDSVYYQLVGGALPTDFPQNEAAFDDIAASFDFLPDRQVRYRNLGAQSSRRHGADWVMEGPVYTNAAFGFQVAISPGWRYANEFETQNNAPDAAVMLVSTGLSALMQSYIVEPIAAIDPVQFEAFTRARVRAENGGKPADVTRTVDVGGTAALEEIYYDVDAYVRPMDVALLTFTRDGAYYKINSMWASEARDTALQELAASHAFLSFPPPSTIQHLEEELARTDYENSVGPGWSLRGGVFRDFENEFRMRKPPGLWDAWTGEQATSRVSGARVAFSNSRLGVTVFLFAERINDVSLEQHHRFVLENTGKADVPANRIQQGDLELLVSSFEESVDGYDFAYQVISAARDDRHLWMLISGLKGNVENARAMIDNITQGLEIPAVFPPPQERDDTRVVDHRLGYQLTGPTGWHVDSVPLEGLESLASSAIATTEDDSATCMVLAICTPDFSEEAALKGMLNSGGFSDVERLNQGFPSSDTLSHLMASRSEFLARSGSRTAHVTVWMTRRQNTQFIYMTLIENRASGDDPRRRADEYKSFFSLID